LIEQQHWLGAEQFQRPLLARREVNRLRENTKVPIQTAPELPHEGLIDELVRTLSTGGK
jgi:hypothetical protein